MSVLVKGMDMPQAGNWKTIRIYYEGTCAEPNWQGDCKYMQGCEAVSVPPHGRLIDADALMQQIEHDTPLSAVFEKTMRRYLYNAPTIIEAEEG